MGRRIAVAEDRTTWQRIEKDILMSLEEAKESACLIGMLFFLAAWIHMTGEFVARTGCSTDKMEYNLSHYRSTKVR